MKDLKLNTIKMLRKEWTIFFEQWLVSLAGLFPGSASQVAVTWKHYATFLYFLIGTTGGPITLKNCHKSSFLPCFYWCNWSFSFGLRHFRGRWLLIHQTIQSAETFLIFFFLPKALASLTCLFEMTFSERLFVDVFSVGVQTAKANRAAKRTKQIFIFMLVINSDMIRMNCFAILMVRVFIGTFY